jgi:hypothetical protein
MIERTIIVVVDQLKAVIQSIIIRGKGIRESRVQF